MSEPVPVIPIERFEIFATNLDHPECVAFDRDSNLWAGGEAGQVYRIDRAGKVEQITTLGSFNGGLAFSPGDELFVCNPALGIVHVRRDGTHEVFASHAGDHKLVTPNFALFDSRGNMYVTDSGNWRKENGFVFRFDKSGNAQRIAGPFGFANGLALSADEKTLFMVESDKNRLLTIELQTAKSAVAANNVGRLPDGVALDERGTPYVSCYASDDIHRIDAAGKPTLFAYDPFAILLSRPTNMAFAPDEDWMYVANLGRTTVTRAKVGIRGRRPINLR